MMSSLFRLLSHSMKVITQMYLDRDKKTQQAKEHTAREKADTARSSSAEKSRNVENIDKATASGQTDTTDIKDTTNEQSTTENKGQSTNRSTNRSKQSSSQSKTQSRQAQQSGSKSKGQCGDPSAMARKAPGHIRFYSIDDLDIGSGAKSSLKAAGFKTIQSLAGSDKASIAKVRNIGPKTMTQISVAIETLIEQDRHKKAAD